MNNDQLEIGAPVSRADHRRITAHYRLARQMVIRGDSPDFETAIEAMRAQDSWG
jgi:hypothetical protein